MLIYFDTFDVMNPQPDIPLQAIGSGAGIMAGRKRGHEYLSLCRVDGIPWRRRVQRAACAPIAAGWHEVRVRFSDEDVMDRPHGLARAILFGDGRASFPYICNIAKATGGAIKSVTRDELTQAHEMLRNLEGVGVCYASASTVAAVRNECREQRIGPGQVVLLNLTGRGLPEGQS